MVIIYKYSEKRKRNDNQRNIIRQKGIITERHSPRKGDHREASHKISPYARSTLRGRVNEAKFEFDSHV